MKRIQNQQARHGLTLLECLVAISILAMGMVITAQVLALYARNRGVGDRLLAAQWEAANAQEKIAAIPFAQATPQALAQVKLSPEAESALPGAELHISMVESPRSDATPPERVDVERKSPLPSKRIRVEVSWPNVEGPAQSVVLTSWKFAPKEGAKP